MPQLVHGDTVVVGYDPDAIDAVVHAHRVEVATATAGRPTGSRVGGAVPPGNSLDADQRAHVAETGATLADGLQALLQRVRDELHWNDARGVGPYRLGMHDGLRFAEDAVVNVLRRHGYEPPPRGTGGVDA